MTEQSSLFQRIVLLIYTDDRVLQQLVQRGGSFFWI